MRTNIIAVALMLGAALVACDVQAGRYGGSSFSSSRSYSSSSYSSRSYSSPSRSYSSPARSTTTVTRTTTVVKPRAVTSARPVVIKQKVVNKTVIVNKTSHHNRRLDYYRGGYYSGYPKYSYYNPAPRPSYVQSNAGWYAFGALAAYMILSDDQQQAQGRPDVSGLTQMTFNELSQAIWQDGSMSRAEVAIYNEWKKLRGNQ